MKIKQQRQINAFLVNLFGNSRGDMLFRQQEDVNSNIFLRVVRRTNLWDSEQAHGKDYFDVTMKKCLWHTACKYSHTDAPCKKKDLPKHFA